MPKYDDCDWKELPSDVKEAAEVIGYTQDHWDNDKVPEICQKDWKDLTEAQQEAAKKCDYTEELWDADSDGD